MRIARNFPITSEQTWGAGFLLAVAVLYFAVFSLFVTHRPPHQATEIYFADRITEAHRILIDQYNAAHAGKVKVIAIDFPNYDFSTDARKEILARSLRGEDDGIDLLAVDVIWVNRFAKWCEPLTKYFSESERKNFTPATIRTCFHDGQLVAVPLDMVQGVMYYRDDLLKKFPEYKSIIKLLQNNITWEDFLKLKSRLSYRGPFYVFPASDFEGLVCSYIELLLSLKPDYFTANGFRFNTPEAKRSLQLLVDLVHKYHASPPMVSDFTEAQSFEYFIRNNGLFVRGWTTYPKDFEANPFNKEKQSHLKMCVLPHFAGGQPTSAFGGWNLMIPKACTKKAAVMDFVKFLLSNSSQEVFYSKSGYYPVTNSFYNDSTYLKKYPEIKSIKDLMNYGVSRPDQEEYTMYSKIMSRYFYLAIKGDITVDEAINKVDTAIAVGRNMEPEM
jgi:ABC-type glycerol-3-phosphate transport system substrate-binding protein